MPIVTLKASLTKTYNSKLKACETHLKDLKASLKDQKSSLRAHFRAQKKSLNQNADKLIDLIKSRLEQQVKNIDDEYMMATAQIEKKVGACSQVLDELVQAGEWKMDRIQYERMIKVEQEISQINNKVQAENKECPEKLKIGLKQIAEYCEVTK